MKKVNGRFHFVSEMDLNGNSAHNPPELAARRKAKRSRMRGTKDGDEEGRGCGRWEKVKNNENGPVTDSYPHT